MLRRWALIRGRPVQCAASAPLRKSATDSNCAARPMVDLHDILMTLSSGGVIPALVVLAAPAGSESTPSFDPALRGARRPAFPSALPPAPEFDLDSLVRLEVRLFRGGVHEFSAVVWQTQRVARTVCPLRPAASSIAVPAARGAGAGNRQLRERQRQDHRSAGRGGRRGPRDRPPDRDQHCPRRRLRYGRALPVSVLATWSLRDLRRSTPGSRMRCAGSTSRSGRRSIFRYAWNWRPSPRA